MKDVKMSILLTFLLVLGCALFSYAQVTQPPPPSNVNATDGTYTNKVHITWNFAAPPGERYYGVWRNTTNNPNTAVKLLGNFWTHRNWEDDWTAVPGQVYYYWVKTAISHNTSPNANPPFVSVFSLVDTGYASNPAISRPSNMALWLRFHSFTGNGTATPDHMGRNDALIIGVPTNTNPLVSGKVNKAIILNQSSYLRVPNDPSINFGKNDFSIFTWIKTSNDSNQSILDKRDMNGKGYHLFIYGKRLLVRLADIDESSGMNYFSSTSKIISDGDWHLVGVTIDRDDPLGLKLYADDTVSSFNPMSKSGSLTNTADLLIGRHKNGTTNKFVGKMDEFFITARALTQAEVLAIYNAGSNGMNPYNIHEGLHLIAHWNFDNGDAYDISGNGAHGIIHGAQITSGEAVFDGNNDYIEIANSSRITPPTSGFKKLVLEVKVKMHALKYYNLFLSHSAYEMGAHTLKVNSPATPGARPTWRMRNVKSTLGISGGRWGDTPSSNQHHGQTYYWGWEIYGPPSIPLSQQRILKIEFSGDEVKQYLNGSLSYTFQLYKNGPILPSSTSSSLIIGKRFNWTDWYFKGKIDEIKIWAEYEGNEPLGD